jgi:hypothetical protein
MEVNNSYIQHIQLECVKYYHYFSYECVELELFFSPKNMIFYCGKFDPI